MAQMIFGLAALTPSPLRSTVRRSSSKRGHFRPAVRPHRHATSRVARPARFLRRSSGHAVLGLLSTKPLTLTPGLPGLREPSGLPESAGLRGAIPAPRPERASVSVRPGLTGLNRA